MLSISLNRHSARLSAEFEHAETRCCSGTLPHNLTGNAPPMAAMASDKDIVRVMALIGEIGDRHLRPLAEIKGVKSAADRPPVSISRLPAFNDE